MTVLLSTIKDNGVEVNISELLGQEREDTERMALKGKRKNERKKKKETVSESRSPTFYKHAQSKAEFCSRTNQ